MFTVDNIISDGCRKITWGQRYELKESLNHGKSILQTEDQLAAYLSWYGEMHKVKCLIASQNLPYQELGMRIHIVDWGCGQAIASLCFLESLEQRGLLSYVRKVTLIEPSKVALNRAKRNIEQALNGHSVEIECLNQKLPSNGAEKETFGLDLKESTTVHLFSNILDLVDISLRKTAEVIERGRGTHYVLCMGPCNGNKSRIDDFCSYFTDRVEFSNVEDRCIAHTSDTNYPITCKTRCFYIQTGLSHIDTSFKEGKYEESGAYDDYDTAGLIKNGLLTEKLVRVYNHISRNMSAYDKVYLKPEMGGDTPDLVIVRRWKGIVVMNVFEEDLGNCFYDKEKGFTCNGVPIASPLSTVVRYCENILTEKSSTLLRNALKEKNGWYAVRPAVWFPDASREQLGSLFITDNEKSKVLILGAEDFGRAILDVLDLRRSRSSFTDEAYKEFVSQLKTGWHTFRDGDPSLKLRPEQEPLAVSIEGRRQKINGVAGSGKTQVLASRAVNCQLRTGGDILILTFNVTLVNYIRYRISRIPADFLWSKFTISNYHRFFVSQARNHHIKMSLTCFENENFFEYESANLPKYSAILIDEVQDYQYPWLKILEKYFLAEKGEFVLFGDTKQNIYRRVLDQDKETHTPIPGQWNKSLNTGMRFDNPRIAFLAMDFQKHFFPEQVTDNIQNQPELGFASERDVEYRNLGASVSTEEISTECLKLIEDNELNKGKTVILSQTYSLLRDLEQQIRASQGRPCMTTFETKEVYDKILEENNGNINCEHFIDSIKNVRDNKKLHFSMETDQIKVSSIHSYKGWDAENVILIIQPDDSIDEVGDSSFMARPELIYTAITRAKHNLFVLNIGNNLYDGFFRTVQN